MNKKQPRSPYILFIQDQKDVLKEWMKIGPNEAQKKISARYKSLSKDEKQKYVDKFKRLKSEFGVDETDTKPRKTRNVFQIFMREQKDILEKLNNIGMGEGMKIVRDRYKSLTKEEKQKYVDQFKRLKSEFDVDETNTKTRKIQSGFHIFLREQKDILEKWHVIGMGEGMKIISARYKSLTKEEKQKYVGVDESNTKQRKSFEAFKTFVMEQTDILEILNDIGTDEGMKKISARYKSLTEIEKRKYVRIFKNLKSDTKGENILVTVSKQLWEKHGDIDKVEVIKLTGERYKRLSQEEKQKYIETFENLKSQHVRENPVKADHDPTSSHIGNLQNLYLDTKSPLGDGSFVIMRQV